MLIIAIYSDSDYKRFCLGNQPFVSVSSIRFFFNAAIVSWFFLKSSNCLYAFSLNIFNLSILGTSCLIKSVFVSSRLISTTNSSAEAKSLILGVLPFIPFQFSIVLLFFQTKPYLEYLLLTHMYMPFPTEIMWELLKILLLHLYGYDSLFLKVLSLHPSQSLTDLLHLSLIADNL